jgi:DNA-binding SARP family transcriptional activator
MWTIQLLGGLAARRSQQEVTRFRTQKSAALLAFLAFYAAPNSLPQPRDVLIEMLWPETEPEAGRNNLSKALSFLRRVLEPPSVPSGTVILADRASVRLNPAALTSDVLQFESALRRTAREGLPEGDRLALWLEAAELYRGPLLPGFYEEWIVSQATRLSSLFVEVVGQVAPRLLAAGRLEDALALAERAVQADALSEGATWHLMRVFAAMQQPSQALRAYRQLETRLCKELEDMPSEALLAYARELRTAPSIVLPAAGEAAPGQAQPDAIAAATPAVTGARGGGAHDVERTSERLRGGEFLLLTTTRFFDREREIARLSAMLSTPRTRLVTLTGAGGTGKTRLALELATRLVEVPPGGAPASAVFVPLADVGEPGRLFEVILRALGVLPTPGRDPLDQLEGALTSLPKTLLILDNFEQLVEEGAVRVRALLARTAVKLLGPPGRSSASRASMSFVSLRCRPPARRRPPKRCWELLASRCLSIAPRRPGPISSSPNGMPPASDSFVSEMRDSRSPSSWRRPA